MFYNRPNHTIKILFCFALLHFMYSFWIVPFSSSPNVMEFDGFLNCIAKRSVSSSWSCVVFVWCVSRAGCLSERGVAAGSRFNRITIALQSSKILQEDCYKISILIITTRLTENLFSIFVVFSSIVHCNGVVDDARHFAHVHGKHLFIYLFYFKMSTTRKMSRGTITLHAFYFIIIYFY